MMVTTDFHVAKRLADHMGMRVGGTFVNGTPTYWLHAPELSEDEAHERAFELRNGRARTSYEKWLMEVAQKRHERVSA